MPQALYRPYKGLKLLQRLKYSLLVIEVLKSGNVNWGQLQGETAVKHS